MEEVLDNKLLSSACLMIHVPGTWYLRSWSMAAVCSMPLVLDEKKQMDMKPAGQPEQASLDK